MALGASRKKEACLECSADYFGLSVRERQILEILYRRGEATAREVHANLLDAPSYSAVRATLKILERKRIAGHKEMGLRYVFFASVEREQARRSALLHLAWVFFDDSIEDIMGTLLEILPNQAATNGGPQRQARSLKEQINA
jgi:predicted transcriptional regulator